MKKVLLGALAIVTVFCLVSCGEKEENTPNTVSSGEAVVEENNTQTPEVTATPIPKSEQEGTAGSNIPLKDNLEGAKAEVEKAMVEYITKTYGDEVEESKITVDKVYSAEDEQEDPTLKEMNLGMNEVAFEVSYELKVAEGVDGMKFTAGTGEFSEETRWVTEKHNVGILRPATSGDARYEITSLETGF